MTIPIAYQLVVARCSDLRDARLHARSGAVARTAGTAICKRAARVRETWR